MYSEVFSIFNIHVFYYTGSFIIIGLVLVKRMKLDRICAMSIFYLPYITGQAVGPTTAMIVLVQEECGLAVMSGLAVRVILWILVTGFCVFYTMRYCRKIVNDPSKSIMGEIEFASDGEELISGESKKLNMRAVLSVLFLFLPFLLYAFGTAYFGWGFGQLLGFAFISAVIVALLNQWTPNEFARRFMSGAGEMGGVCMLICFGRVAGLVLVNSNMVNTISNVAVEVIGRFGAAGSAAGMFLFTTLFNLLMPNGLAKIPILMPLFIPIGDILGITRQVLALCYQMGDGLTNFITPMSTVLASGLMIANVNYGKWMKYVAPYVLTLLGFAIAVIMILQTIGWA